MLKALAVISLILSALTFCVWVIGWVVLIRDAGFSEALRRSIYLWPGNLLHAIIVVGGVAFLLIGLTLMSHGTGGREQ